MAQHDIVPMGEQHIADFRAVLDLVSREKKYLAFLEAPPLEEVQRFVRGVIACGYPQFVALDAGRVVGWCDILPITARPIYVHCGTVGIGMLPTHRGQGLGRRLLRTAIDAAFAFGLTRIELDVREGNGNAIALYKSIGFAVEGFHRQAALVDGAYENVISMALLLP